MQVYGSGYETINNLIALFSKIVVGAFSNPALNIDLANCSELRPMLG